jgi:hypothetical protein
VVTRAVATALALHRTHVDVPYRADDPASGVYVDDAVLGLQLVAHGTDTCGPFDVVDPAPVTVGEVVAAVLTAARAASLTVSYGGTVTPPDVRGGSARLEAAVGWAPDIALGATVDRVLAATLADVRARLDPPPSVTERWGRRRADTAGSSPSTRRPARLGGRHRYENAG